MNKFYTFFSGIIIGIGVILPGVSGSVIAIMLGIYDKIIYLINDSKKNLSYKIRELLPVVIGLIVGVMLFGNVLIFLIEKYEIHIKYLFIGLILAGVPVLKKQIYDNCSSKIKYNYLIITMIISLILFMLPSMNIVKYSSNDNSFIKMLIAGFLYISGKIIPGISSSFFLMILGMYDYILNILSNPFSVTLYQCIELIPFIIGVIIGLIILLKLINYLLVHYFVETYSVIIGFVLGSIIAIFPGFKFEISYLISVLIMVIAYYFTYKIGVKD